MDYQKINTVFKRADNHELVMHSFSLPEFDYLSNCAWECTEKIDGTNIHVDLNLSHDCNITFNGRTKNSQIPAQLLAVLTKTFTPEKVSTVFAGIPGEFVPKEVKIFGEGYGAKIQKGGGRYLHDSVNFIVFDIWIDGWWLKRPDYASLASKFGLEVVPVIGYMTIPEAVEYVKKGFVSSISEDRTFLAEGIVMKTPHGLLQRNGDRIISKLKYKDFHHDDSNRK